MTTTAGLLDRHAATLAAAIEALRTRTAHSAYPDSPSPRAYGEGAAGDGEKAFRALLGEDFPLRVPGASGTVAAERSPFGLPLAVRYPRLRREGLAALLSTVQAGMMAWRDAGPAVRSAVCVEVLARLHARVFELAHAVMHTSGQPFVMAFQTGGAHALDRALEAVAAAAAEQARVPERALWEQAGTDGPVRLAQRFHVVPRGVALVIGCRTFPTWSSWPGMFASLATGNPVVVKPHPRAVLPLAITVQVCQEVLADHGFDPRLVTLAAEDPADGLAAELAVHPEVRLVDFTGSSAFGDWLVAHARQAVVFAEKSGVNPVVIDSTDDFRGMCANLAFSLSLCSGQLCTTPQNLFVPRDGIETDVGHVGLAEVGEGIGDALAALLADEARAVEVLGAIVDDRVLARLERAARLGRVLVPSRRLDHPRWPAAQVRTPTLVGVDVGDRGAYGEECFAPVAFVVSTASTAESLEVVRETVHDRGALTAAVYSTSPAVLAAAEAAALDVGVALSENLTRDVHVNQSAAFSDYHGTGANPAATAAYTDAAFVANRFHVVQVRRQA